MFWFASKKDLKKESVKIKSSFRKRDLKIITQAKRIAGLEERLTKRIDDILLQVLDKIQKSKSPIKSKTSLREVQEKKVIHAFRQTKKQVAKDMILELQKDTPIPKIKTKVMSKFGISKASFYNYLKELDQEEKVQVSPKV